MKLTYVEGEVIKGFGRGSKELGIPTGTKGSSTDEKIAGCIFMLQYFFAANFSDEIVSKLPADFETGIYFGWAKLGDGPIHKMVVSIGWNPFYKNEKKSMVCPKVFHFLQNNSVEFILQRHYFSRKHTSSINSRTSFTANG